MRRKLVSVILMFCIIGNIFASMDYRNCFNFDVEGDTKLKEGYKSKKTNLKSSITMNDFEETVEKDNKGENQNLKTKIGNAKTTVNNFNTDDISIYDMSTAQLKELIQNDKYDEYTAKIQEIEDTSYERDLTENEEVNIIKGKYNKESFANQANEYKQPYKYTKDYKSEYSKNGYKTQFDNWISNVKIAMPKDTLKPKKMGFSYDIAIGGIGGKPGKNNNTRSQSQAQPATANENIRLNVNSRATQGFNTFLPGVVPGLIPGILPGITEGGLPVGYRPILTKGNQTLSINPMNSINETSKTNGLAKNEKPIMIKKENPWWKINKTSEVEKYITLMPENIQQVVTNNNIENINDLTYNFLKEKNIPKNDIKDYFNNVVSKKISDDAIEGEKMDRKIKYLSYGETASKIALVGSGTTLCIICPPVAAGAGSLSFTGAVTVGVTVTTAEGAGYLLTLKNTKTVAGVVTGAVKAGNMVSNNYQSISQKSNAALDKGSEFIELSKQMFLNNFGFVPVSLTP